MEIHLQALRPVLSLKRSVLPPITELYLVIETLNEIFLQRCFLLVFPGKSPPSRESGGQKIPSELPKNSSEGIVFVLICCRGGGGTL